MFGSPQPSAPKGQQEQTEHFEFLLSQKTRRIQALEKQIAQTNANHQNLIQQLQLANQNLSVEQKNHEQTKLLQRSETDKDKELIKSLQGSVVRIELDNSVLQFGALEFKQEIRKLIKTLKSELQKTKQEQLNQQQRFTSELSQANQSFVALERAHQQNQRFLLDTFQTKKGQLKVLKPAMRDAITKMIEHNRQIEALTTDNLTLQNDIKNCQLLLEGAKNREQQLTQEVREQKNKTTDAYLEVPTLQFQIQEQQAELKRLQEENTRLRLPSENEINQGAEIKRLQADKARLDTQVQTLQEKNKKAQEQALSKVPGWKKWAFVGGGSASIGSGGFTLAALGYASALWNPAGLALFCLFILIAGYSFYQAKNIRDSSRKIMAEATLSTTAQLANSLGGEQGLQIIKKPQVLEEKRHSIKLASTGAPKPVAPLIKPTVIPLISGNLPLMSR